MAATPPGSKNFVVFYPVVSLAKLARPPANGCHPFGMKTHRDEDTCVGGKPVPARPQLCDDCYLLAASAMRGSPRRLFSAATSRAALRMAALAILVKSDSFPAAFDLEDFGEDGLMGGRLVDNQ